MDGTAERVHAQSHVNVGTPKHVCACAQTTLHIVIVYYYRTFLKLQISSHFLQLLEKVMKSKKHFNKCKMLVGYKQFTILL